ncbi:hypothetical protein KCP73_19350 [Salmonella enterica subsp. enterica]|nr:hypothetical protein KCP73_19350 [Salmonella enterica subsp. enterica]
MSACIQPHLTISFHQRRNASRVACVSGYRVYYLLPAASYDRNPCRARRQISATEYSYFARRSFHRIPDAYGVGETLLGYWQQFRKVIERRPSAPDRDATTPKKTLQRAIIQRRRYVQYDGGQY